MIDHLFAQRLLDPHTHVSGYLRAHHGHTLLACLLEHARKGDLCLPLASLNSDLRAGLCSLPKHLFDEHLVQENDCLYLRRNWECEQKFIFHLKRLCQQIPNQSLSLSYLDVEKEQLNGEQKRALMKAASQTLTLITGGPGTGKTYTAAILIRLFIEHGIREVAIAAPTGKATANLRVALGALAQQCTIKTLHSLLKREKLFADLIVVDEGSMIDAELMASLFSAIDDGARLVLLGDKDQLPPVESGHFFADLAHQEKLVAPLESCLRVELQEIVELACKIKRGEPIPYQPLPPLKELIKKIVDQKIHVLTPLRKGIYGVDHLNQLLFLEYQKKGAFHIPIVIRVNAPALGLYNGDTGLWNQTSNRVSFSEGRVFAEHMLPPYEYGYVLSVHKSQGSEYDRVMVLLPQGSEAFGREMLYTALTRAKKGVEILAHEGVMAQILSNHSHRYSGITHNSRLL